ncbi:mitochondrial inner membrane protein Mitofilin [Xylariomycetidae sp. FL0641]|nr:mitochondrial inner membrane protein Mitofilin [Xylariomycetidae sp. FL0641]
MLRTSLRSVRAVAGRPAAAAASRQWQPAIARQPGAAATRCFADKKSPWPPKLPADTTTTAAASDAPQLKTEARVASTTVGPDAIPPTPPAPETVASAKAPKPVKKKGFFRRLRNFVATLVLLGAIGFGGGVWYSRINDNFHDFFTEFVPFGEQAVLYLEELDFKKRYPNRFGGDPRAKDTGAQVKIAPQSGASWRVADSSQGGGRQSSATREVTSSKSSASAPGPDKRDPPVTEAKPRPDSSETTQRPVVVAGEPPKSAVSSAAADNASDYRPPEVDEPSRYPPAAPIDPLTVRDAEEPVVQDLVHMLNDIITVVNADNADARFSSTLDKAKRELNQVGEKIREMKAQVESEAAEEVSAKIQEFESAAVELVSRVEKTMALQEEDWRAEFEKEMKRIQATYDARIKSEIEKEKEVNEKKLENKLLQQAIQLRKEFLKEVSDRVEEECQDRLGKLGQLSDRVKELEKLTTSWNDVVDLNLRTQQLHVAVEAVRASLEDADHPRPFVRELVALKEIASDDQVVNAAIGSINPSAYQRGIATPAQLIDRFRRVASEVRKASLLPDEAGVASHASSYLLSKVLFKKQGLAAGDDVESILTRTQTFLEEGNLDAAAREMNGLHGWAKTLSRDWLGEVRRVLEVQQALDVIATQARLQSLQVE